MCRYIISYHAYSGCKLSDVVQDHNPRPPASVFASLRKVISTSGGGNSATEPDLIPQFHQINIKTVIQCPDAASNPASKGVPTERRVCPDAVNIKPENEVEWGVTMNEWGVTMNEWGVTMNEWGVTMNKWECPVCIALEQRSSEARKQAEIDEILSRISNQTRILPIHSVAEPRDSTPIRGKRIPGKPAHHHLPPPSARQRSRKPKKRESLLNSVKGLLKFSGDETELRKTAVTPSNRVYPPPPYPRAPRLAASASRTPLSQTAAPPTSVLVPPTPLPPPAIAQLAPSMIYSIGDSTEQATIFSRRSHESERTYTTTDVHSDSTKLSVDHTSIVSESGIEKGTALYKSNCKAFEEVLVTLSSQEVAAHNVFNKLHSFQYWVDAQLNRYETWGHDINVEESVLDVLPDAEQQTFDSELQDSVRRYLLGIREAIHAVGRRIKLLSQYIHLVENSAEGQDFLLMTTQESISSSLEEIDDLIGKLYSLAHAIRMSMALEKHAGPYSAVLDTIETLDLVEASGCQRDRG